MVGGHSREVYLPRYGGRHSREVYQAVHREVYQAVHTGRYTTGCTRHAPQGVPGMYHRVYLACTTGCTSGCILVIPRVYLRVYTGLYPRREGGLCAERLLASLGIKEKPLREEAPSLPEERD